METFIHIYLVLPWNVFLLKLDKKPRFAGVRFATNVKENRWDPQYMVGDSMSIDHIGIEV